MIGINVSGAEYTWETYPSATDFAYLQQQGIELIRLPFCWEKMQPELGGPLDPKELQALKNCLAEAAAHGIEVIIDLHNYGRYDSQWQEKAAANYGYFAPGEGDTIGSAAVPYSVYADFWSTMATELKDQPGLAGYDIMNEPNNMGGADVWPKAAQAAVDAIRAVDMKTAILVEGTQWASAEYWPHDNGNLKINDPADNLYYEAHIYFDGNGSGRYAQSYDAQGAYANIGVDRVQPFLDWLEANDAKGFVGEFGVPDNDPRWLVVLDNFIDAIDAAGVSGTYWNYTYQSPTGVDWWPVDDPQSVKPLFDGSGLGQLAVLKEHLDSYKDPYFGDGDGTPLPQPQPVDAPTIASVSNDSGVQGDGITNDQTLTLSGSAKANVTIRIYDGSTLLGTATANASGAWSYTTTALANGSHSLTARAVDASGNTSSASAARNITIDTVAPSAPTIASFSSDSGVQGDGITSDRTLTLAGSATANTTVQIYDGSTLLGTATANGSGAWSFTTAALSDGAHSLTARAVDAAGNASSPSAVRVVTVDTVGPTAPTIASFSTDSGIQGDNITNDQTLTLTGTAAPNSAVQIYDGSTLLGSATVGGDGAWTFTTAALANGSHSLTARAVDAAANTSSSAPRNVTIDAVAPSTPTIASFSTDSGVQGDNITNDQTLTLAGSATANTTVQIYDGTTLLGSATANGSGAWSFTTVALSNGTHSLTARAVDGAGNASAPSAARNVTIDTVAPTAPTIASFSTDSGVQGDGITNDQTLTLVGTATANSAVQIYDGSTLLGTATANGDGAWTFTTATLANGNHSLTARAADAAGNTSSSAARAVTIDAAAPSGPTIASFSTDSGVQGDNITNDQTLTLVGNAQANSTVQIYDGSSLLGTATANGSGAWSFTTAALANGAHSLTARAVDAAGNTSSASAARNVTIDTIAPSAPTIASFSNDTGNIGDGVTTDSTLVLTGTAAGNSTVQVYDGSVLLGSATANAAGAWSFTTAPLTLGAHSLTARATDAAGNTSTPSSPLDLSIAPLEDPTMAPVLIQVKVSGDQYQGLPQFRLLADGVQIGDVHDVTAVHRAGQWEVVTFAVDAPDGLSDLSVEFLNDAWGGTSATDRNLFVDWIKVNGTQISPLEAVYDRDTMTDIAGQSTMAWDGLLRFDLSDRRDLFGDFIV